MIDDCLMSALVWMLTIHAVLLFHSYLVMIFSDWRMFLFDS